MTPKIPKRLPDLPRKRELKTLDALNVNDVLPGREVHIEPTLKGDGREVTLRAAKYQSADAATTPGLPDRPPSILLAPGFEFSRGVYIMVSPTGAGKTTVGATLVAFANAKNVPAAYFYHFEPRMKPFKVNRDTRKPYFSNPISYLADLRSTLKDSPTMKMAVLDSITLPMKAHSAAFPSQATFTGGVQPSDRAFLDELSSIAAEFNAVLIVVLNETLIPYVADLYGAVEGYIRVESVESIVVSDRSQSSARSGKQISLPIEWVNATLIKLGYGPYSKTKISRNTRGYRAV